MCYTFKNLRINSIETNYLLGSYTPVSVPHSLFRLTNMRVSKQTNMNLHQTHQHEPLLDRRTWSTSVTQPPMYCTVCMLCPRSLCYHEPCTFRVIRLLWLQNHNNCHFLLNCTAKGPKWLTPSFFNMHSWRHQLQVEQKCYACFKKWSTSILLRLFRHSRFLILALSFLCSESDPTSWDRVKTLDKRIFIVNTWDMPESSIDYNTWCSFCSFL